MKVKRILQGVSPLARLRERSFCKIYDWLFSEYGSDGYKFAVVFDLTSGEYSAPENPKDYTKNVYFLDELFEEIVYYRGVERCENEVKRFKEKMK